MRFSTKFINSKEAFFVTAFIRIFFSDQSVVKLHIILIGITIYFLKEVIRIYCVRTVGI